MCAADVLVCACVCVWIAENQRSLEVVRGSSPPNCTHVHRIRHQILCVCVVVASWGPNFVGTPRSQVATSNGWSSSSERKCSLSAFVRRVRDDCVILFVCVLVCDRGQEVHPLVAIFKYKYKIYNLQTVRTVFPSSLVLECLRLPRVWVGVHRQVSLSNGTNQREYKLPQPSHHAQWKHWLRWRQVDDFRHWERRMEHRDRTAAARRQVGVLMLRWRAFRADMIVGCECVCDSRELMCPRVGECGCLGVFFCSCWFGVWMDKEAANGHKLHAPYRCNHVVKCGEKINISWGVCECVVCSCVWYGMTSCAFCDVGFHLHARCEEWCLQISSIDWIGVTTEHPETDECTRLLNENARVSCTIWFIIEIWTVCVPLAERW